jgi:hypothetical protein
VSKIIEFNQGKMSASFPLGEKDGVIRVTVRGSKMGANPP